MNGCRELGASKLPFHPLCWHYKNNWGVRGCKIFAARIGKHSWFRRVLDWVYVKKKYENLATVGMEKRCTCTWAFFLQLCADRSSVRLSWFGEIPYSYTGP